MPRMSGSLMENWPSNVREEQRKKLKSKGKAKRGKQTKQKINAESLIARWKDIQRRQNVLDYEKAQLAYDSWRCFHKNDKAAARFFTSQLGLAWAVAASLVAQAHVYSQTYRKKAMWEKVGWLGMKALARLPESSVPIIEEQVQQRSRTKNSCSHSTLRKIIADSGVRVGPPINPMGAGHGNGQRLDIARESRYYEQLVALSKDVEKLIKVKKLDPKLLSDEGLRALGRLATGPKRGFSAGRSKKRSKAS